MSMLEDGQNVKRVEEVQSVNITKEDQHASNVEEVQSVSIIKDDHNVKHVEEVLSVSIISISNIVLIAMVQEYANPESQTILIVDRMETENITVIAPIVL